MLRPLLKVLPLIIVFSACSRSVHNSKRIENNAAQNIISDQPIIAGDRKPQSLMDLPQSQDGGFVLAPGYYEAEFKSYCLQPGTPDPRQGDAYLQTSISGYRKEIVESVLLNSKTKPELDQKNIQLLLWSVVSGSDFNKLSYAVQSDARELLTSKQIFELQGGVLGTILILIGFVLAHLSNANVIQWRAGWEKTAHITFHILGPIIVLLGIIKWVIDRVRR